MNDVQDESPSSLSGSRVATPENPPRETQRTRLEEPRKGKHTMNAELNLGQSRPVHVSPSPDTFLGPETVETCAGCGEIHPVERLSLFFLLL